MNCKPGDLAVVVRCADAPHEIGLIVEVLEVIAADSWIDPGGRDHEGPGYGVRKASGGKFVSETLSGQPVVTPFCVYPRHCLRPLRDNPGEDETISWAGLPKKLGEAA